MNILPFEKYEMSSKKLPDEILESIFAKCERRSISNFFCANTKPLTGVCEINSFKVYRSLNYGNPLSPIVIYGNVFLPIATGTVSPSDAGSKIDVVFRINLFVIYCMVFLFFATLFVVVAVTFNKSNLAALAPLGVFIFFLYILMSAAFWLEVPKIKALIQECT